jgi:hypothetical protein
MNAADDEAMLLRDVRIFVARYISESLSAAADLILEYAHKRHFTRIRFHSDTPDNVSDDEARLAQHGIDPKLWGTFNSRFGIHVAVNWDESSITYVRSGSGSLSRDLWLGEEFYPKLVGFGLGPPYFKMRLVCLFRSQVLSMLREVGRLPPESQTEQPAQESQAERSEPDSQQTKQPGPAIRLARELMAVVYPQGQWRELDPAAVRHACDKDLKAQALLKRKAKPLPSRDSFARAMERRS